jgi:hypothetical protein
MTLRRAPRELAKIQRGIAERNPAAPKAWRTGDVILEDDDIFGDGVNIAARLEALAEPGGICRSGAAHEQCATSSTSPSKIWASRASRILPTLFAPNESAVTLQPSSIRRFGPDPRSSLRSHSQPRAALCAAKHDEGAYRLHSVT